MRLDAIQSSLFFKVGPDLCTVTRVGQNHHTLDTTVTSPKAIQTLDPIDAHRVFYYFEVKVTRAAATQKSPQIAVGYASDTFLPTREPGSEPGSVGYRSEDGRKLTGSSRFDLYGPTFNEGDIVGCGVHIVGRSFFFTRNGVHLGQACAADPFVKYHPTASMSNPGEEVRFNFGAEKFLFDPSSIVAEYELVQRMRIAQIPPQPPRTVQRIIESYLVHKAYRLTLSAFSACEGNVLPNTRKGCYIDSTSMVDSVPTTDASANISENIKSDDDMPFDTPSTTLPSSADQTLCCCAADDDLLRSTAPSINIAPSGGTATSAASGASGGATPTSAGATAGGGATASGGATPNGGGATASGGLYGVAPHSSSTIDDDTADQPTDVLDTTSGTAGTDVVTVGTDMPCTASGPSSGSATPTEGAVYSTPPQLGSAAMSAASSTGGCTRVCRMTAEESLAMRTNIKTLIDEGRIADAIASLNSTTPDLLTARPLSLGAVYLRTQQILEMLRNGGDVEVDAVKTAQANLGSVLFEGQPEHKEVVLNTCLVLAKGAPSPEMDLSRRRIVARKVNSSILRNDGCSPSHLHLLVKHLTLCRHVLREVHGHWGPKVVQRNLVLRIDPPVTKGGRVAAHRGGGKCDDQLLRDSRSAAATDDGLLESSSASCVSSETDPSSAAECTGTNTDAHAQIIDSTGTSVCTGGGANGGSCSSSSVGAAGGG